MGKIWRECGALDLRECGAEDVNVGKRTSFPRSVKLNPNETVILSWVEFKSRAQSCHCGKTAFEIDGAIPAKMTRCTCSFCAKRGTLYAYYEPAQFRLTTPTVDGTRAQTRRRRRVVTSERHKALEIEQCARCGGKLKVIASIEEPEVIERILNHRRERGDEETSVLPLGSRAPPQAQLF